MRPKGDEQSESPMKFFTPELYLRYNSSDEAVADRADREWEEAIRAYRKHLGKFSKTMNDRVRDLAEKLCLHDAELLFLQQDLTAPPVLPPLRAPIATISLRANGKIVNISYFLRGEVGQSNAGGEWPFSKLRAHWLYDEIDFEPGHFPLYCHRVLLSDGRVVSVPFFDVVVHSFSEQDPQPAINSGR
jgi:hypothetical protein